MAELATPGLHPFPVINWPELSAFPSPFLGYPRLCPSGFPHLGGTPGPWRNRLEGLGKGRGVGCQQGGQALLPFAASPYIRVTG